MNYDRTHYFVAVVIAATALAPAPNASSQVHRVSDPSAGDVWVHAPAIVEGSLGPVQSTTRVMPAPPTPDAPPRSDVIIEVRRLSVSKTLDGPKPARSVAVLFIRKASGPAVIVPTGHIRIGLQPITRHGISGYVVVHNIFLPTDATAGDAGRRKRSDYQSRRAAAEWERQLEQLAALEQAPTPRPLQSVAEPGVLAEASRKTYPAGAAARSAVATE